MPQVSRLEPQAHSSTPTSSTGTNGDHDKRDADAKMNELSTNKTVVDGVYLRDAEKGSPPPHLPHSIKDGGLTAWGTVLGT